MSQKIGILIIGVTCLWGCSVLLTGCDASSNGADTESGKGEAKRSADGDVAAAIVPASWKTVSEGDWVLSIPDDWVDESGFYYPEADRGTYHSGMGAPTLFCVIGVRPLEEGATADDEINAMLGSEPLSKTPVTVCGKEGHLVQSESNLALVFEMEVLTSDGKKMAIEHINCGAPTASKFKEYEQIFRHILDSVDCSTDCNYSGLTGMAPT